MQQVARLMTEAAPASFGYVDPLDRDDLADLPMLTTRRMQARIALVAAETATRFAREGRELEPMAWMSAPRRAFGGRAAIDACTDFDACVRALTLHRVVDGLDEEAEYLDWLVSDEAEDDDGAGSVDSAPDVETVQEPSSASLGGPRLFTAVVLVEGREVVQAFAAAVVEDASSFRASLRERRGAAFAEAADVRVGFDAGLPLVEALVSPALADMLALVDAAPGSPLAADLDVILEQRFRG